MPVSNSPARRQHEAAYLIASARLALVREVLVAVQQDQLLGVSELACFGGRHIFGYRSLATCDRRMDLHIVFSTSQSLRSLHFPVPAAIKRKFIAGTDRCLILLGQALKPLNFVHRLAEGGKGESVL